MSSRSEWWITSPQQLTIDAPVSRLEVRVVGGAVNVVGTDARAADGRARLEVSAIEGPPLRVVHQDGTLTVAYDDIPWQGFLKLLDGTGWRRSADVTLAVPATAVVKVGAIGAGTVVSGVTGGTEIRGITGETTLTGLGGRVRAHTVSGGVEAQGLSGELAFHSVSGNLTVLDGAAAVKADTVNGDLLLDLAGDGPGGGDATPTDLSLTSVSGEIAVRLPGQPDAEVEAHTTAGTLSSAFDGLRTDGHWGARRLTGTLGTGHGRLKATTVSGGIALLRRPPARTGTAHAPTFVKDA
ncbi:hypothetical protein V1J52_05375 [Streptomyces sp. TRM 70351]|uniref:DUF4097 family beta strand repeat-containing protein n=1 Tax=Streptomyces sp. TRM 70351 TaxID=3116552 RepID=UPI002E7BCB6C|nr:hypothetical protein [Streptomyces sp. TRM 70351]MEE1927625.1 hypothetical protein [Streptomyces sp. TRM 70351]